MENTVRKHEFDAKAKRPGAEGAPSGESHSGQVVKVVYPLNQHSQRPL